MSLHHKLRDLNLDDFHPGMKILDVGCGYGRELQRLADRGCIAVGVDPFTGCVDCSRALGFEAHQGYAEDLPFADSSFDGVISQVALPYTNEKLALREIARVLKPGGVCRLSTHGAGYYWLIFSQSRSSKRASYALRCLANTWLRHFSRQSLPGTFGDTVYQSSAGLTRLAHACKLEIVEQNTAHRFYGMPVFIYSTFRKPAVDSTAIEVQVLAEAQALSEEVRIGGADGSRQRVATVMEHVNV